MKVNKYRIGLLLVTTSSVAWSLSGVFMRLIALDNWTILAWRGIFGAVWITAVLLALEGRGALTGLYRPGWQGWAYMFASSTGMIFFITSLRLTSVAHVSVIYAAVPFVAALLGWFVMRERPAASALVASLIALCGVALMVGSGGEGSLSGDFLAFGMTVCMAITMIIARHYPDRSFMPASCFSALVTGLVCWPFAEPWAVSGYDIGLLVIFGFLNTVAGLALFTIGARYLPAVETALIGALDAPLAPLWVWLAFGDMPGRSTLAGGIIVFAAVVAHILHSEINRKLP